MRLFGLRIFLCVVAVVSLTAAASAAPTRSLTSQVEFAASDLSIERVGAFDSVRLPGTVTTVQEGHPELPLKLVRFVLPEGTTAAHAQAFVRSSVELDGNYTIRPRQPEVPLSRPELARWVDPDERVYSMETVYPSRPCILLGTGNMSGHTIATVAVFPVQYLPAEGRLVVNEEIEIRLSLTDAPAGRARAPIARSLSSEEAIDQRLAALVVNADDVPPPSGALGPRTGTVDYLIITGASYTSTFQELADWKSQKGLSTEVVSTSWIYGSYDGVDNAEKVRNCVIDYYENFGTMWVLLGGDTTIVPARIVFAMNTDAGNDEIRCDLYYADVDGTWNDDGDGRWGEVNQDNIDMYADLFVGRAPVDNVTEAARFVGKVLTYEGAPGGDTLHGDYQRRMLFLAEVLWSEPWTDGGVCKNMIDDESVPEQFDPITKLYQTNGQLTRSRTLLELNAGQNIVNHNGHAYYNVMSIGSSALYNSHMDGLTNGPRYGIWYSIGCWPAAIDYNCIAEHWVNAPNGGGVAFVGNSRFGWGSPGNPGNGTSDVFDREFFHQLFNEGLEHIGMTNAAHKDAYVELARASGYHRYCLYELNLLGDPEMRIWTEEPVTASANHPITVPLEEHPFVVAVSRDGAPVAGADVFLSGTDVNAAATTNEDGIAILFPSPTVEGELLLVVTGQGIRPYTASVTAMNGPSELTPPDAVANLNVADPFDLGSMIRLDWTGYAAPADFAHYKVYRDVTPFDDVVGMVPIETGLLLPDATVWEDTSVENGQSYYYAVTAVDVADNELATVSSRGPIASSVNSKILVWDADDGDTPFDGIGDDFAEGDGTERPWVEALDSIGELYTITGTLPPDLSPFDIVIYLGGVLNFGIPEANAPMTETDIVALTAFIDAGGSVYAEEPNFGGAYFINGSPAGVELWSRFHATYAMGCNRETGNVEYLDGEPGTPTEGMSFDYDYLGGADHFVALVTPDGVEGSYPLWSDQAVNGRGSVYVDPIGGGRLYMVPVLLGGVADGVSPSTRLEYVTRILDEAGLVGTTGVADGAVAGRNWLAQNAPNPFNPSTSIRYSVGREGAHVTLAIYDVSGRLVTKLVDAPTAAGEQMILWDGRNAHGRQVGSGIYFSRLSVDTWTATRKMVLLK